MATVKHVYDVINEAADFSTAMDFDNPGLLVGDPEEMVRGTVVALDATDAVIAEAAGRGANLIVTHHPVIFHPIKKVTADMPVYKLVRAGISVISAHTNLDKAPDGVNDILCARLGLQNVAVVGEDGMLRAGTLARGMTPPEFAYYVKRLLDDQAVRYCDGGRAVERVAVCGGSGGSFLAEAAANGCQALVTGDVKHDVMLDAVRMGITVIDAGHYGTERFVVEYLAELCKRALPDVPVAVAHADASPTTTI